MTEILPKINYDDFYRFVTSLSILCFIVLILTASYLIISPINESNYFQKVIISSIIIYFILAVVSGITFIWAVRKWYARQKLFDEKLANDIKLQKTEIASKKLEVDQKEKKLKGNSLVAFSGL